MLWPRHFTVLVMFKLFECCGNRSRHKTLYRPSRRSLAKAAGRSTEREEIITLTFVRKRDERAGVAADTGLKLHLDAKGMYVESVRPGSVGAPDGFKMCPQAIRLHSQLVLRRLLSTPNHAAWGCPQLRNSLGQPASRFGGAARPDLLSPAGAEIGLLPGDGIVVVNGQECVDVHQVERTISNSMSCSLKVKRGLPDTDRR